MKLAIRVTVRPSWKGDFISTPAITAVEVLAVKASVVKQMMNNYVQSVRGK